MVDWRILQGDALEMLRTLPDCHVQCVVTSPPYFGLRDYGVDGQLGLEQLPDCTGWATGEPCGECYVCRMTAVFREVKRVLRDDGTLWLNMGDSYVSAPPGNKRPPNDVDGNYRRKQERQLGHGESAEAIYRKHKNSGLKEKDLMGIPWRLAFSLQADGWWLRSDIIWAKKAPMPESVQDRPTRAHEYVFLMTKSARYFYDQEAVRECGPVWSGQAGTFARSNGKSTRLEIPGQDHSSHRADRDDRVSPGRNMRDVWTLSPACFNEAHFATFPPALPETCIKAGTSERGCCPECGAPWKRVVAPSPEYAKHLGKGYNDHTKDLTAGFIKDATVGRRLSADYCTLGWQPTCNHAADPIPCLVLDPFAGAGTTLLVANRLGRRALGIELNPEYVEMASRRIVNDAPLFNTEYE